MMTGHELRVWRVESGLTQRELAQLAGVARTTVSRLERSSAVRSDAAGKVGAALARLGRRRAGVR